MLMLQSLRRLQSLHKTTTPHLSHQIWQCRLARSWICYDTTGSSSSKLSRTGSNLGPLNIRGLSKVRMSGLW